jgi:hypothetical protein
MEGSFRMSAELALEQRVAALEKEVAELRQQLFARSPEPDWISKIAGSMKDTPGFEEAMEYGRAFRWADRPPAEDEQKP